MGSIRGYWGIVYEVSDGSITAKDENGFRVCDET